MFTHTTPHRLAGLAILVLATGARAQVPLDQARAKISDEIWAHRDVKRLPAGADAARHQDRLRAMRLNDESLDTEECVVYVDAKLAQARLAQLAAMGVEVSETGWVPPVPGHHPRGFHLMEIPYDRLVNVATDDRIASIESAERRSEPMNDLGGSRIGLDVLQAGPHGGSPLNGSGVRLAVADSGVDLNHPDLPAPVEAFDMTDGSGPSSWGTDVSNPVSNHGTHVAGTAVGNGSLSGGQYVGAAPGASFYFYKIGGDTTSNASITDMIEAINRAAAVDCDIFTMSYGGYTTFQDGSDAVSQAVDAATATGMTCFFSAGNAGNDADHSSTFVPAGTTSGTFQVTVDNTNGTTLLNTTQILRLIWIDTAAPQITMQAVPGTLGIGELFQQIGVTVISNRGTRSFQFWLIPQVPAGQQRTYSFQLTNGSTVGNPRVHVYALTGNSTFDNPDPNYTVKRPALADTAIAVGALVHRNNWTDFQGNGWTTAGALDSVAPFSSRGPRIDNAVKPEVLAPGAATVSLLGTGTAGTNAAANAPWNVIDNDGFNLNGTGPANYVISSGTSMASPMAAGAAALLLQAAPSLTPAEIEIALISTAGNPTETTPDGGYGILNMPAAWTSVTSEVTWVDFDYTWGEAGTYFAPFDTLAEAVAASSPGGRIWFRRDTSSSETIVISTPRILESPIGSAVIGD